jgi:hypothetical protein
METPFEALNKKENKERKSEYSILNKFVNKSQQNKLRVGEMNQNHLEKAFYQPKCKEPKSSEPNKRERDHA